MSSRKLKVSNYGLAQTFWWSLGRYALPAAEVDPQHPPLYDPEVPAYIEAILVYVATKASEAPEPAQSELPSQASSPRAGLSALRSWTRQDKSVPCTMQTGRNGPLWNNC